MGAALRRLPFSSSFPISDFHFRLSISASDLTIRIPLVEETLRLHLGIALLGIAQSAAECPLLQYRHDFLATIILLMATKNSNGASPARKFFAVLLFYAMAFTTISCGHTHAATSNVPMETVMQAIHDYGNGHQPASTSITGAPPAPAQFTNMLSTQVILRRPSSNLILPVLRWKLSVTVPSNLVSSAVSGSSTISRRCQASGNQRRH